MKYLYLVTIKNNSFKYTSPDDILKQLRILKSKFKRATWHKYFFELDSVNRWHLHTLVCTATVPFFTKLKVKGWTIHLRGIPLDDYPKVLKYIHKDINLDLRQQDIISQNYYLAIDEEDRYLVSDMMKDIREYKI